MSAAGSPRRHRRAKGTGSVYRRGRYWYIRYTVGGRDERESTRFTNYNDAMKLLAARMAAVHAGRLVPGQKNLTVDDLLAGLRTDYELRGKASLTTIGGVTRDWHGAVGKRRAADLKYDELQRVAIEWQRQGKSNATINRRMAALSRAYSLARMSGRVGSVPRFPKLEERSSRTDLFSRQEFEAIHRHLPAYLKDFFEFATLTGVRRGQLASTRVRNVDTSRWTVTWDGGQTKSRKAHAIPLDGRTLEIVQDRLKRLPRGCDHVFWRPVAKGKTVPIGNFRKAWARACKAAGLQAGRAGKTFHGTRRTAVTNLVAAGVPEKTAMSISGHTTRAVFDRYTIVREDEARKAVRLVSDYFDGSGKQRQA